MRIIFMVVGLWFLQTSLCGFEIRSLLLRANDNQYQIVLDIHLLSTSNVESAEYLVSTLFHKVYGGMHNIDHKDYIHKIIACSLMFDTELRERHQDFINQSIEKFKALMVGTYPHIKVVINRLDEPGAHDYVTDDIDYMWAF